MEEWVKHFMYDLPRKAIREGKAYDGRDVDEVVFEVDGFKIFIDGNEWRSDVVVLRDGEEVLKFVYRAGNVEVLVDKLGVSGDATV